MKKVAKITLSVLASALIGLGAYAAHTVTLLPDDPWEELSDSKLTPSGEAPKSDDAAKAASSFFSAWSEGDLEAAAMGTDDPASALKAMMSYRDQLAVSKVEVLGTPDVKSTPHGIPPNASLSFGYHATTHLNGHGAWSYAGSVSVIKATNGRTAVHWKNSVLHPRLTDQTRLDVGRLPSAPPVVTDSTGTSITTYASLKALVPVIAKPNDPRFLGRPGTGVLIKGSSTGKTLAVLHEFTASKPAKPLKLTIDARYQAAAEKSIAKQGKNGKRTASLVAIEPSTGHVLAIANSKPFNAAFSGLTAPGSTMKIITSAALMEHGVTPDSPAPCPVRVYVDGKEFHNVENSSNPTATLHDDFIASCNTGFIGLRGKLSADDLADEARDVFGIGQEWHTGLPNADGRVPKSLSQVDKAAVMIGQGSIQMNPLAMASVAATVQSGTFRQPVIRTDLPQQPASRALSSSIADDLRGMMRATATHGTAAKVMSGLGGGAKTGTAEVGSSTDSWFVGYLGNVAAAAMVEGGGHGGDAAGPAVRSVLIADQ